MFLIESFAIADGQVLQVLFLCVATKVVFFTTLVFLGFVCWSKMEYKAWLKAVDDLWDVSNLQEWAMFNDKYHKKMDLNVIRDSPKPNIDMDNETWLSELLIDEQILLLSALENHIASKIEQYYNYLLKRYKYQRFDLYEIKNVTNSRYIITKMLLLFRINGKLVPFPQNLFHYIDNRISYFQKKNDKSVKRHKQQVYSNLSYVRTQGFDKFPMFLNGLSIANIADKKPSPGESTLNWIARLTIQNKKINSMIKQISQQQATIEKQTQKLQEMKEDISAKQGSNHAYTAKYAARLINILTKTEIPKSKFRDSGELFYNLLNDSTKQAAAISTIPCASTLSKMSKCFILYFMEEASQVLVDSKSPLFGIIDSKTISGSGSRKVLPIHIGGYWGKEDLILHWTNGFRFPKQKNKETGVDNKELMLAEYNLLKFSKYNVMNFMAVDTGASAVKGVKELRLSGQDLFRFTFTLPDLAHGFSTMYSLSSNFLVGLVKCKFSNYNLIGWILRNLLKIVNNNTSIKNQILQYYKIDTYLPLIAASDIRFGGYVDAIDSLLYFKPKRKNEYGQWIKDEYDFDKLLLIAAILNKYSKARSTKST